MKFWIKISQSIPNCELPFFSTQYACQVSVWSMTYFQGCIPLGLAIDPEYLLILIVENQLMT